jgi:hypothetical protein
MRFTRKSLVEMQNRITQLGMDSCRVCGSGQLLVHKRPGLVTFGGVNHERDDPRRDPESNILFMVMTCRDLCGKHSVLRQRTIGAGRGADSCRRDDGSRGGCRRD